MLEPVDVLGSSVVLSSLDRIAHVLGVGTDSVGPNIGHGETQLNWAVAGLTGRTSDRNPRTGPSASSGAAAFLRTPKPRIISGGIVSRPILKWINDSIDGIANQAAPSILSHYSSTYRSPSKISSSEG